MKDLRSRCQIVSTLVVATLLVLVLFDARGSGQEAPATSAKPIKIGVPMSLSGPLAANGQRAVNGAKAFFTSRGMQVAGRPVQLLVEDTEGKPQTGITKTRRLVESEAVNALIAYISTPVTYANRGYLTSQKMPTIVVSGANALVQPASGQFSPYIFRSWGDHYGEAMAQAEWLYKKEGLRKVVLVALNFGGALEPAFAFKYSFEKLGGQVVAEINPPLASADWNPWISQIQQAAANGGATAVVAWVYAIDAIRMVKGWQDLGLKDKLPVWGGEAFTSEMLIPGMGTAAVGMRQFGSYCPTLKTPENQEFVRIIKSTGHYPAEYDFYGWAPAQTLYEAIKSVNGKVEDRDGLIKAIEKVNYIGPSGRYRYNRYHSPVLTIHMQRVELVDGEPHNVCIGSVPDVSTPTDIPFPPP